MPKYLFSGSYTTDGIKGLLKEGGSARRDAVKKLIESLGGTIESLYFAFGGDDFFIIADVPDNVKAAAGTLIANASEATSVKTTVLLTPEEIDQVSKISADYRSLGQ